MTIPIINVLRRVEMETRRQSGSNVNPKFRDRCAALLKNFLSLNQPFTDSNSNTITSGLSIKNAAQEQQNTPAAPRAMKRKHEADALSRGNSTSALPTQPRSTSASLVTRLGMGAGMDTSSQFSTAIPSRPSSINAQAQPPSKRVKENSPVSKIYSSSSGSLLSRMQQQNGSGSGFKPARPNIEISSNDHKTIGGPPSKSGSPTNGFSIKGAANEPRTPNLQQRFSSH